MSKIFSFIIPASILFSSLGHADDTGLYTGTALTSIAAEEGGASSRENGFSLIAGYSFHQNFSSELVLMDIGNHQELGMKGRGGSLSLVGRYPVNNNLELIGEFGGISINLDINEQQNALNASAGGESLKDGPDRSFYYAFGINYKLNKWKFGIKHAPVDLDADLEVISMQVNYQL